MSAYYNENDAQRAAWLRELIKANVVAPGEVDERSIEKVEAQAANRVLKLRGYGDCIVAPLAKEFIEACQEVIQEN